MITVKLVIIASMERFNQLYVPLEITVPLDLKSPRIVLSQDITLFLKVRTIQLVNLARVAFIVIQRASQTCLGRVTFIDVL